MVIKESLKYAVYPLQVLNSSPAMYIKMPKIDEPAKTREDLKIITVKQFSQIVDYFGRDSAEIVPFFIAFYTGMRRGEVCGLSWNNVDLINREINVVEQMKQFGAHDIRIGKLKTAASRRTIPIGNALVSILKKQRLQQSKNRLRYGKRYFESQLVCTKSNGKPITPNSVKYLSSLVHSKLGFPFNFHSLRHTHATLLLEAGATPKEVQVRLGHSKIETTMNTYIHITSSKKKETADLFESIAKI
ncbi:site-specific integrase [Limosilactobacillus secaliphilus]|nr:site-specific integrase [Limosilactobacillus secaliphilus]